MNAKWMALMGTGAVGLYCVTSLLTGGVQAQTKPVQQVTLWESHNGGPVADSMTYLVNWFNRTHPGIHVTIDVTKASTKALGALAAGNPPVLAEISHYDGSFLNAHALLSLNPYVMGKGGLSEGATYPSVWTNGEVGSQHYRIMADAKVSQLTYNIKLFKQAGIKSVPQTWTQLAADLAIIKRKFPTVVPLAYKDSSAHILPPFLANGGQLFLPGSNQHKTDFLSPAAYETFNYFRTLYAKHEMIFAHGANIRSDFGAGKIAVADGTSAGYEKILEAVHGRFPVGVFAYPKGSSGHTANLVQGLGFVMMIDHTKAQNAGAATFIKWWFSEGPQIYWGEHSGFPPETRSASARIPSSYMATHPGTRVAISELASPYTIPRPVPTAYNEVQSVLDAYFYKAVTGQTSVKMALTQLQQQADAYLSGSAQL